jgi:hypothetical protein
MDITCSANGQSQTVTLNYYISYVANEAKDIPSKHFPTVNGTGTRHET